MVVVLLLEVLVAEGMLKVEGRKLEGLTFRDSERGVIAARLGISNASVVLTQFGELYVGRMRIQLFASFSSSFFRHGRFLSGFLGSI